MDNYDELILDDSVLEDVANAIEDYCAAQEEVLYDLIRQVMSLSEDWIDEETFSQLLLIIQSLSSGVESALDQIQSYYPGYFRQRAQQICDRPSFNGGGISQGSGGITGSATNKIDIKSSFEKIFEKTNKEIKRKIFSYLMKINFIEINARSSYFDPDGKTKRGMYNDIMGINLDSKTLHQDLLRLTGQHMYFHLKRKEQLGLIRSFNSEVVHNMTQHDIQFEKYLQTLTSGQGLDMSYIDVKDNDYRNAMAFFSNSFKEYIQGGPSQETNRYFSQTYNRFVQILKNMDSLV